MSSAAPIPLRELRGRVARSTSRDEGQALLALLAGDPRAGAARLARTLRRRLESERRERERLERLFELRGRLRRAGAQAVAGVDEAGVGPLAGPVVAAAVVLPDRVVLPGLDDSKRLAAAARERLSQAIRDQAQAWSVAAVSAEEVDRLNVYRAALEAMRRALAGLACAPDHVLVDARVVPGLAVPQTPLVHGDARDGSIAAASILAKVWRDAHMCRLDRLYPGYGFARHKGYPTPEHLQALRRLGPCAVHRRSFAPVARWAAR